ncbi:MAG: ABC transporter permease [Azospirillaceae bacterium]
MTASGLAGAARGLAFSAGALLLALATAGLLLAAAGQDPVVSFQGMVETAFGSTYAIGNTIMKALPRLLPALGIALALRAGLWNIGAEGQIYVGAAACTAVALFGPLLPFPLGAGLALVAAMAAGAAWAAVPGVLRAYRGISEVITTLMLVYVAIQLTNWLIEGPWLVENSTWPATPMVPEAFRLPRIWPGTLVNAGVVVALFAAVLTGLIVTRTTFGLWIRAVGGNERASAVIGLPRRRLIVAALAASGAFAGLAGGVEVLGIRGRLLEGFSPGYGFEAIAIALLGRLNPAGIVAAALLFGALDAGAAGLQVASAGISSAIAPVIQALAVAYLLAGLGGARLIARRREARSALARAGAGDRG